MAVPSLLFRPNFGASTKLVIVPAWHSMNDLFLWILPVLAAAAIGLQLRYGRVPIGWAPNGWRIIERTQDERRFWLFIVAQILVAFILLGQALTA